MWRKELSLRFIPENIFLQFACSVIFILLCLGATTAEAQEEQGNQTPNDELILTRCKSSPQFGNKGWEEFCGTNKLPDFMSTKFDPNIDFEGNWTEEYKKDGKVVAVRRVSLYKTQISYGSFVVTPSRQDRRGPWSCSRIDGWEIDTNGNRSRSGAGPIWCSIGENGELTSSSYGSVVMSKAGPNQMSGTWAIDDNWTKRHEKGTGASRRAIPRIDRVQFVGDKVDEITYGDDTGTLEFKYQGPVYGHARANRRNVYISVYGENLWGFHRMWIDPVHNLEIGGASYIQGKADPDGSFNSVIGITFGFVTWPGMFPGKKILWIDDIPIPFELVLTNFPEGGLPAAKKINAALQQEESEEDTCKNRYISGLCPDNKVQVRFFSSIGSHGEENPKDEHGQPTLERSSSLRIGEPFMVEVEFRDDTDCSDGMIAFCESFDKFICSVPINSVDGSKKKFRTAALTPVSESKGKEDEVLVSAPNLGAYTKLFKDHDEYWKYGSRASVLPPFSANQGTGSISITILEENDEWMPDYLAKEGVVTLLGPGTPIRLKGSGHSRHDDKVPVGLYTVRLDIMGSSIEVPDVRIEERGHQDVKIGGSGEFGRLGYSGESRKFFDVALDQEDSVECQYSRGEEVAVDGSCSYDLLPKGSYDMTVSPTLLPQKFPVTVEPGKSTIMEAHVGLLVIQDSTPLPSGSHRELIASVKKEGSSSPEASFQKKTTQVLPVGEYIVEVREKANDIKHQAVINIHPARETWYFVAERPEDSRHREDREAGRVGYSYETVNYFEKILGGHGSMTCRYSRPGEGGANSYGCYMTELPSGTYDMTIEPTLFPETFSVTVEPGKDKEMTAHVGLLVIHDDVKLGSTKRQLIASVTKDGRSSDDISFQTKTTQVLPVGAYTIEVREKDKEARHQAVININPAKATFYSVGETPSKSLIDDDFEAEPAEEDTDPDEDDCTNISDQEIGSGKVNFWPPGFTASVPSRFDARGDYEQIDPSFDVWIYTKDISSGNYKLSLATKVFESETSGPWGAQGLSYQGDITSKCKLGVILARPCASSVLKENRGGLEELPEGARVIFEREVKWRAR